MKSLEKFRKITAEDPIYKFLEEKFEEELYQFEQFLRRETNSTKSDKPSSYKRYLIRFIVHLKEIFEEDVTQLKSIRTVEQIDRLTKLPHFMEFNQTSNRFYSATFAAFKRYIKTVTEGSIEDQIDQAINDYLQKALINIDEDKLVKKPTKRKNKQKIKDTYTYPRSELEMIKAKKNSDWRCEISSSHETFINEQLNKPFVEGHHLIPMFVQDQFEYTIDFADNIVTLCPNCHRKIHFGLPKAKFEMIQLLYEKRKELYPKYGIEISLKDLLAFYNIDQTYL